VTLAVLMAIAPLSGRASAAAGEGKGAADPAIIAMLGSACPPDRARLFAEVLGLVDGDSRSLADHFEKRAAAAGGARFEAESLTVDAALPGRKPFRVEGAQLALEPSRDGASLHFELEGPIFGAASRVSAAGTIEWGKGPFGGDKLTVDFTIDDAALEVLRIPFPERFDPAFAGPLDLSGHGEGVVGEHTTEDAPASALKGKIDGAVDWVVLGRRDALTFSSGFAIDDRSVRLSAGHLKSFGIDLNLSGWFDPDLQGQFHLNGGFASIDVAKVAADWQVPTAWRAVATLSGKTEFWGKPGQSFISYDAKAADVSVPALGGYSIRTGPVKLAGRVMAINAEVSGSVMPTALEVGPIHLDALPFGINWWRGALNVTAANSTLWGGAVASTISYRPAEYPAFEVSGRLENMRAGEFASKVLPSYGLDLDGIADIAYRSGQDAAAAPYFAARASLNSARVGRNNLFEQALAALASLPTPLSAAALAADLKKPKRGGPGAFDKLFVEVERRGDALAIGGISGRAGDLLLDGSGSLGKESGLDVAATLYLPPAATEALLSGALWAAPLRGADGGLFVPLHIGGKPAEMKVTLTADFVGAVAKAHAGAAVTPFGAAQVEHVATSGLATLPDDPSAPSTP